MKLSYYIKSFFYTEKMISSEAQLEKDFLEFPPFPLVNTGLESNFNAVNVYGPGRSLYFLKLIHNFLCDEKYQSNEKLDGYSEFIDLRDNFHEQKIKFRKSLSDMKGIFKSLALTERVITSIILFVFSPLLLSVSLIFSFYLALRFGIVVFNLNKITFRSFGAFVPLVKGKEIIVLRPNLAKKSKVDISAIMSHEHIHFLQYMNTRLHQKVTISSPNVFIKENVLNRHALYLFEINEVEARLHELVLSYYREFRKLPQELDGFIGIFLAAHEIAPLLKNLVFQEDLFSPSPEGKMFFVREKKVADELRLMLLLFKKEDHMVRFVTEVMAVMYGNLLKLYGDEKASNEFKSQVDFPNFYDRLYGGLAGG